MAKNSEARTARELKKELETVMKTLVKDDDDDGDDYNLDVTDYAIQTLRALKELKLKQNDHEFPNLKSLDFQQPPQEFRCPISGILMKEPVVVASGQTYEELAIQNWLKDGNLKCPQTDQILPHTVLIPNHSIRKLITNWCKANKIDIPRTGHTTDDENGANDSKEHLVSLLERLSSSSISDSTAAVKELRFRTTKSPSFRAHFGEITNAIPQLFIPFLIERSYSDVVLLDDLVVTILNISTHESNKRKIVEGNPLAVPFLTESLRSKSIETRSHAVAAISALSTLDSNKPMMGTSGVIRPLVELIREGHSLALKDTAFAISNLCTVIENRERAISEGAVIAVMDKIIDRILLDEMLEILAKMSGHQRAIEEMEEHGMLFCLFRILREDTSEHGKENCVAVVYAMCFSDRMKLRKINEVKNACETLSRVARTGTPRAKRKAAGLLERLNRFAFTSHTA